MSIDISLVTSIVSAIAGLTGFQHLINEIFDYVLKNTNNDKIAIEYIKNLPDSNRLSHISSLVERKSSNISKFILVTQEIPSAKQLSVFKRLFEHITIESKWIGINDLPSELGSDFNGDLTSLDGINQLQKEYLEYSINNYSQAHIGNDLGYSQEEILDNSIDVISLKRQLPIRYISQIMDTGNEINEILNIGSRYENVTVVLSDIKNFSSLVKVSKPEILNDTMEKYYQKSRRLVWKYNGVLDKFIGDAVLAIFGYPYDNEQSAINAMQFSQELISLGKELFDDLLNYINESIATGTRVGISTGDIWPLNIGDEHLELSFVGDTINMAARLEKNAEVNSILIDNRTRTKIIGVESDWFDSQGFKAMELSKEDAKGQLFNLRTFRSPIY